MSTDAPITNQCSICLDGPPYDKCAGIRTSFTEVAEAACCAYLIELEAKLASVTEERDSLKRELEEARCRHGWRGSVPENGQQIATPCPACGAKSLFIGNGGHLTCARVPSDRSDGCHSPSVETEVNALKQRAELAEQQLAASRKAVIEECAKVCEKLAGENLCNHYGFARGDQGRECAVAIRTLSASAAKEGK